MKTRPSLFYFLFLWLLSIDASAQTNSTTTITPYPAACIAPSEQTAGLDFTADSSYLRFSNSTNEIYESIDGLRMKRLVEEQAGIAQRYKAAGNKYWGRIIGTDSDHETAEWMMAQ